MKRFMFRLCGYFNGVALRSLLVSTALSCMCSLKSSSRKNRENSQREQAVKNKVTAVKELAERKLATHVLVQVRNTEVRCVWTRIYRALTQTNLQRAQSS